MYTISYFSIHVFLVDMIKHCTHIHNAITYAHAGTTDVLFYFISDSH